MDLLRTGLGLKKTIRNVSRLREIVLVFARHGFDEFISGTVTAKIPNFVLPKSYKKISDEISKKGERDLGHILGQRLRLCFEELGPAFVKFGQLLGSREDIFNESFIDEMKKLRDQVKIVEFSLMKESIEKSYGKNLNEVFSSFNENPIGSASVSCVYKAVLISGESVVVKVRRPNIENEIGRDFDIFVFLAGQAEKISEDIKSIGLTRIIKDFSIGLQNELNFNIEARNCERFKRNTAINDVKNIFYFPEIFQDYTRENIIVMEELKGIAFSDKEAVDTHLTEIQNQLNEGLKILIQSFLKDGFFHADLHGGNFFYLDNGKIGIIDFGLMGALSKKGRGNFVAIIYSLLNYNYENLVFEFLEVAEYDSIPDVDSLVGDVRTALNPYVGLTVQQTNFSHVLKSIVEVLREHQIYLPTEWFIVFRALTTLDGVGKSLKMDFDLFSILEEDIHEIIKNSFRKEDIIEETLLAGRDLVGSARIFPRHLKWFLREWSRRGYAFEIIHKGHERPLALISNSIIFLGHTLLSVTLFSIGASFIGNKEIISFSDIPILTWVLWPLGLGIFLKGLRSIKS